MDKIIKRILVIANLKREEGLKVYDEIKEYFEARDTELKYYTFDGAFPSAKDVDMAISLGGDGTLLFSAEMLGPAEIPILAVNTGTFGFITEVSSGEWRRVFENYVKGRLGVSARISVEAEVIRKGKSIGVFHGLNEAVVSTRGVSRLIGLKLFLSKSYVGRYRADGLIIATPTGSTAYSMGAGGPILHPEMEAFILNPICPFTLSDRPLVIPAGEHMELEIEPTEKADVILYLDGRNLVSLQTGDRIEFREYPHKTLIIRSDRRNFYDVLRSKLNWSGEPGA